MPGRRRGVRRTREADAMPLACAVECIHTYSRIHDDLPAMDDDDYRRGNLTNHKVFGEGIAVLAGDALLTQAFEIAAKCRGWPRYEPRRIILVVAHAAGSLQLIAGQVADLEGEGRKTSAAQLRYIHERKTSALLVDISFVFIGADKTAKVMMKIAGEGKSYFFMGGAELAEKLGYDESIPEGDKLAAVFFKGAKDKGAEIIKDVLPSQFAAKAVPVLTENERDIPKDILDILGDSPLEEALSTPTSLGMVLRPREFQRIILIQMGQRPLANELERKGTVFPKTDDTLDVPMGPQFFSEALAHLLLPLLAERSAFGPQVEQRILLTHDEPKEKRASTSSLPSVSLRKIGAAYNGYRTGIMDLVAHAQEFVSSSQLAKTAQTRKLASVSVDSLFTPLSASYLKLAYWDEVGVPSDTVATAVEGTPSNTRPVPTGEV